MLWSVLVSVWPHWVLCPRYIVAACVSMFVNMVFGNVFSIYFSAQ